MDNIAITIQAILTLCGGITCVVGGISSMMKLFNPFKELKTKVNEHDVKLDKDYKRMEALNGSIQDIEDTNKVICKSLLVLMNHEITGNGVDKLKEQRDELEQFLIDK